MSIATMASLFDGIGGFPHSASKHDIKAVWASEIEPNPVKVTKLRFPEMKHYGDVTKINGAEVEPVDIITFGSPCQDLSVAGKRAGMQHESKGDETTTRSGLFMEAVRIIKEMRNATGKCGSDQPVRPRFAVWENVPGAFSSNSGEDFRIVLEELAKVADGSVSVPQPPKGGWQPAGAIMGDGVSIAWRVVDAQYWGVPQRRRRIYLVCDFAGGCAPEVLFEREGLRRNLEAGGEAREGIAADAQGCAGGAVGFCGSVARTLTARHDSSPCADRGQNVVAVSGGFRCGNSPQAHSVGFEVERSPTLPAEAGGNKACVVTSLVNRLHFRDDGVSETLRSGCHGDIPLLYENHGQDSRLTGPLDISPTVAAKFGTGGNNTPLVSCCDHKDLGRRSAEFVEQAPTLKSRMGTGGCNVPLTMAHGQANAEIVEDGCPTLNCNHEQPILFNQHMSVRRLTPLECERLQGFPDGWTLPCVSDSARYKALGNSLAIPNSDYVIEGIAIVIQKGVNP